MLRTVPGLGPLRIRQRYCAPWFLRLITCGWAILWSGASAWANGGPFVIKYPGGDPAAKGVLARLDPDLRPARESRLAVLKEDLALRFEPERFPVQDNDAGRAAPLVSVTATYFITNATAEPVEVDFGFPVLRGLYISPWTMNPVPETSVRVDGTNHLRPTLISNSAIYGLLRRRAEETLNRVIAADPVLRSLCEAIAKAGPEQHEQARQALAEHLTQQRGWTAGQAALLVEYVSLRPSQAVGARANKSPAAHPIPIPGASLVRGAALLEQATDASLAAAMRETGWAIRFIGEQKATQWLTLLAGRVDPAIANSYEAIFQAWGGDVRERAVDLLTGKIRLREITHDVKPSSSPARLWTDAAADPTVYARVDYLEANPHLAEAEKAAWRTVLKHLPVIFTFAPMNLLHYQVAFPPHAQRTVTVAYRQYAYLDTAPPRSYQIAYVVHPASLWDSFGPINLTVTVPPGVTPLGSVPLKPVSNPTPPSDFAIWPIPAQVNTFTATLSDKTGELFVGIDAVAWETMLAHQTVAAR